jgi:multiple sugar transport system substrate-binding protein
MTFSINRRTFLASGAGALALGVLNPRFAFAQDARLRLLWWGSQARSERTYKVVDLFKKAHPEIEVDGESAGWDNYWSRLATQTSGGNAPDVMQMDYRYIFEYARRDVLLPLDKYMADGTLDVSNFSKQSVAGGQINGKTYGISLGANSVAMMINKAAWEEAGMDTPQPGQTWEEFADHCEKLTKTTKRDRFYGCADQGGLEPAFETWLRQRGKELYSAEGKLGFDDKDAGEWFAFWVDMRKRGACVPADVQSLDQLTIETSPLSQRRAASCFAHSNQLVGYQAINKDPLTMGPYPVKAGSSRPGQYRKPSMLFSVAGDTKNPEAAAKFIGFFVNDPDAARVLDVERGVPESSKMREVLKKESSNADRIQIEYIGSLGDKFAGPLPPPPPKGAGEIQLMIKRKNEEVGFETTSPEDAGAAFVAEAAAILERS